MANIQSNEPVIDQGYIHLAKQINAQRVIIPGTVAPDNWRADSATSVVATARQLVFVGAEVYRQEYPKLTALEDLPPPKERPALGHRQFTWHEMEERGEAVINVELENDAPGVDLGIEEQPFQRFAYIQQQYEWSISDTWTSDLTGVNLQLERGKACKNQIAHKHDDLLLLADGGPTWGKLQGLYKMSGTLTLTAAAGATSGTVAWATKTGEEIFTDLMDWFNYAVNQTLTIEQPNTMLIPLTAFQVALKKRMGDNNHKNPIQHFIDTLRESELSSDFKVKPRQKLEGLGAGSSHRAILYTAGDPTRVMRNDVVEFIQGAPTVMGHNIVVRCFAKTGATIAQKKKSVLLVDGF
ncbi:MAG: major capsid family protein [Alsobacter sp.]